MPRDSRKVVGRERWHADHAQSQPTRHFGTKRQRPLKQLYVDVAYQQAARQECDGSISTTPAGATRVAIKTSMLVTLPSVPTVTWLQLTVLPHDTEWQAQRSGASDYRLSLVASSNSIKNRACL